MATTKSSTTTTAATTPTKIGRYTVSPMTPEAFKAMRAGLLEASELSPEEMGENFVGCLGDVAYYE